MPRSGSSVRAGADSPTAAQSSPPWGGELASSGEGAPLQSLRSTTAPAEYPALFTYDQPGLYCAPVTAEFTDGATDSARTALLVYDPAELDTILKGRWAEMKAALASGNITAALDVIALKDRDAYGAMFQAMSASHLASIDEILTDLSSIRKLQTGRVEYEMFRRHSDGKLISHPVTFRFDVDGVWRVEFL
jgi:hypothetical protein